MENSKCIMGKKIDCILKLFASPRIRQTVSILLAVQGSYKYNIRISVSLSCVFSLLYQI